MDYSYGLPIQVEEIKAAGDAWTVEGHASTYGNVDLGGDVVTRGAFDKTLQSGNPIRFLLGHDQTKILGKPLDLRSDDKGLWGRFKISKTGLGQDVHTLLRDGAIDSFSIGYIPTEFEFDDNGVRLLKEIDLLEVSLVAVPMNPQAVVTGVKQKVTVTSGDDSTSVEIVVPDTQPTGKKFDEHLDLVMAEIARLLERTEDIAALRAGEGKRLTGAKFEQLKTLRAGVDDLLRLEDVPAADVPKSATSLRLAIARRRLAMAARMESAR